MNPSVRWSFREPRSATEFIDQLLDLYAERGDTRYDQAVTQTEHALQTAALAEHDARSGLVAAALLHDIGHLLVDEHTERDNFLADNKAHEAVGAELLSRWFPPGVTEPVALHVAAKRYLVTRDRRYAAGLSAASTRSLALQGGPMTAAEAHTFERYPHAADACQLRRWDDRAKAAGAPTPPFEHFRPALEALLYDETGMQ